jgi:hypothetical protein
MEITFLFCTIYVIREITVRASDTHTKICVSISKTPPKFRIRRMIMTIWDTVLNLPQ